jgi:hypothetical protein
MKLKKPAMEKAMDRDFRRSLFQNFSTVPFMAADFRLESGHGVTGFLACDGCDGYEAVLENCPYRARSREGFPNNPYIRHAKNKKIA